MGSKLSSAVHKQMLIIGGCELPLEKNPYNTMECLDLEK